MHKPRLYKHPHPTILDSQGTPSTYLDINKLLFYYFCGAGSYLYRHHRGFALNQPSYRGVYSNTVKNYGDTVPFIHMGMVFGGRGKGMGFHTWGLPMPFSSCPGHPGCEVIQGFKLGLWNGFKYESLILASVKHERGGLSQSVDLVVVGKFSK